MNSLWTQGQRVRVPSTHKNGDEVTFAFCAMLDRSEFFHGVPWTRNGPIKIETSISSLLLVGSKTRENSTSRSSFEGAPTGRFYHRPM